MKGQIAVVLIVVALFAGAAIGYFGGSVFQSTVTKTYTLPQGDESETCKNGGIKRKPSVVRVITMPDAHPGSTSPSNGPWWAAPQVSHQSNTNSLSALILPVSVTSNTISLQ